MAALVFDEIALVGEGFVAEGAGKAHLPDLVHSSFVSVHDVARSETLPADLTLDWLQTGVLTHVILQCVL